MPPKTTNTPKPNPQAGPQASAGAEKQQEKLDVMQKLQNLKQVLEKRISEGDKSADLPQQFENLKKLEAKTKKEKLTSPEEQEISEKYEKLDALEKQIAESDDVKKDVTPVPEKPKDFMSKIGTMIEHYKNFFAYQLAPLLASLKGIPFFGGDSTVTMIETFLGMEKTMLFSALREKQIDPVFHPDNPGQDTKAIDEMISMAKDVCKENSAYTLRGFFDSAAMSFADHLEKTTSRKTFTLQELADFTQKNVFGKELDQAKKDKAAEGPSLPVTLESKGVNMVSATRDNKTVNAKLDNGKINIDGNPWQLSYRNKNDVVPVTELKIENGKLMITVDTGQKNILNGTAVTMPYIFESNRDLENLLKKIEQKTPYPIEVYGVEFRPSV